MDLQNIANIILCGRGTIFFYHYRIHLFVYKYIIVVNFFPVTFCFESKFKAIEHLCSCIGLKSMIFYSHRKTVYFSHIFICISIHIVCSSGLEYLSKQIYSLIRCSYVLYMVYCCGVQHDPLLQFVHVYGNFQTRSPGLFHLDQFLTVNTTSG